VKRDMLVHTRMTPELRAAIKAEAALEETTMSQFMRLAAKQLLADRQRQRVAVHEQHRKQDPFGEWRARGWRVYLGQRYR
jgi:uncharacterized protein (DUF1778 family)